MTYRIVFRASSRDEIKGAFTYILEQGSGDAALEWRAGLISAIESLREYPHRCAYAPENHFAESEIRQLIYRSYRIIYAVLGDQVHILHVRHVAQLPLEGL